MLALTQPGDLVLDPYMGVGSSAVAAVLHGRRAAGSDTEPRYLAIARERVALAAEGRLRTRPMSRPVYVPPAPSPPDPLRARHSSRQLSMTWCSAPVPRARS